MIFVCDRDMFRISVDLLVLGKPISSVSVSSLSSRRIRVFFLGRSGCVQFGVCRIEDTNLVFLRLFLLSWAMVSCWFFLVRSLIRVPVCSLKIIVFSGTDISIDFFCRLCMFLFCSCLSRSVR